jgi:hypothetical protein
MQAEEIVEKGKRLAKKVRDGNFEYSYQEYSAREFTRIFALSVVVGERDKNMQELFKQAAELEQDVRWTIEDAVLAKKARKNISVGDYETLMAPWRRLESVLDS